MTRGCSKHFRFSRRVFAVGISISVVFSLIGTSKVCANQSSDDLSNIDYSYNAGSKYSEQYVSLLNFSKPNTQILLNSMNCVGTENSDFEIRNVDGQDGLVLNKNNSWCEWSFEVKEEGTYLLEALYAPDINKSTDLIASIQIDGKFPFEESASLYLPRVWKHEYEAEDEERPFKTDARGNEIAPNQIQVSEWTKISFSDSQGAYNEPYIFYFNAGIHTLRFTVDDSELTIGSIKLYNQEFVKYEEYYKLHSKDVVYDGEITYLQAEITERTNDASINPSYDKLNVATSPSDPKYILLNTIGKNSWAGNGDSISWKVNVPKAGMYKVAFRARQNTNAGLISYRTLYINGEIPFAEAVDIPFSYSQSWEMVSLGAENEELLYLQPGDILTLTCSPGATTKVIRNIQQTVSELNDMYREVIAITSVTPDTMQDYKIESKLPDIDKQFAEITQRLRSTHDELSKTLGTKGSLASSIKYVADVTEELSKKPYIIPERLKAFKNAIESLGSLMLSLSQQPLELDYICFLPTNSDLPNANKNFFANVKFNTLQFLNSFASDYGSSIENDNDKNINVWVSTGRDQAQILDNLIMSDFSIKTGINVELNMVDTSTTLVRAALAGKGPDVALMIPQITPVELAARGALVDLTNYIDDELYDDFHNSAWTSFYYNDKIYALPETQMFSVIFYRTDILKELGIDVPETWDDLYKAMSIIQSKNLAIGIPEIDSVNMGVSASLGIFSSLIMQNGLMNYYTADLRKTQFDTEIAYDAFAKWSDLYKKYGVDRQIDLYSRFRSGEIPLAISTFNTYVQIQQAAPEIRGLWKMAPYLGTEKSDGSIDRSQTSAVTGCVMLKAAENRDVCDEAFQFMKWWVSADVQSQYGDNLENALGITGRYFTANLEAFKKAKWSTEEYELLSSQLEYVRNQPTVIGSYAVSRDLTSAMREVIAGTNRPRRALMLYNTDINEEINRKRIEFGLES